MAGRGGRGALLEAFLAQQQRLGAQNSHVADGDESKPGVPPPSASGGHGTGRANMLARFCSKQREAQSAPPVAKVGEDKPAYIGRGCALLNLKSEPPPITKPSLEESSRMVSQVVPPTSEMAKMSFQEQPPVHKTGTKGKEIPATANYVRLKVEPGKGVCEYEVRFEPQVDSKGIRNKLLNECCDRLGETRTFDGTTLYLPFQLQDETTKYVVHHPVDKSPVSIIIIFKKKKRLGECIHFYNVLFRKIMTLLDMACIGRQHFSPRNAHPIPQHKLELWPGYVTAVDEYEGGIQLCCDASHRVLRTQTALELIEEITDRVGGRYRDAVQKSLIGVVVLTRYNNKTYRVDDIDWNQTPRSTFSSNRDGEVSFRDYYKKQYAIDIKDLGQPLLLSRLKTKIRGKDEVERLVCLVPELCFLTGLTDEMRSDFHVMRDISMYTRITPNQRQAAVKKFVGNIQENDRARALLAGWGLALDPTTVDLMARVLSPEVIMFGGNGFHKGSEQADWGAVATRNKVLTAVDLVRWMIFHSPRDARFAHDFAGIMRKVGPQMGIQVGDAYISGLRDESIDSYLCALRQNINPSLQLVVILFPTARDDRYSAVKKLCCSEMPIASQVINSRTLSKPDRIRSVVQKIALQINCKLGGTLWAVKIPLDNCMVCGIDAFHDATKKGGSVAGFVASINQTFTRWFSRVCLQGPVQELVDGLKTCFISALKCYYDVNHRFPDRVVIYRDGVGDGQLKVSAEYEVPQFESCFQHISPDYHPKLTVVVCHKRINTRIFSALNSEGGGGLENPPPGTIVDHTITRRNWYDFFLVSQHVRQGTVTPTHYVVIHDTANMKTDHVQQLTYKLCHLYYNWPGTIRVPAPCQYAHKLAQLVGQSIHRPPSEKLADRLYFL
jgi:aubergine-like protein